MNQKAKFVACLCLILLSSISCNRDQKDQSQRTELIFWHSFVSSTVPALDALIARFENEHPNIKIKAQYVPTGDALIQKLVTAIQSKSTPDISWIHADFLEDLVKADAIYPMSEFLDGANGLPAEDLNDIYPSLIQAASWRGTLYSLPMEATNLALLYNRELFRKAGLDPNRPPQNWDELYSYAKKMTVDNNGDGRFDQVGFFVPVYPASGPLGSWMVWQWYPFLWQAGGEVISHDQTHVLFNNDAGVKALEFWSKVFHEFKLNSFTIDYDVAFASQTLAMALDGPWNLPRYKDLLKNLDWGITWLPAGPEKQATIAGGEYLTIFKQSQYPNEAWSFLKWILRPDIQAFWAMQSGYLPVRHAALQVPEFKAYLETNLPFKAYVEQMEMSQSPTPIDYHGLRITRFLAEGLEKSTVGNISPRVALDEAARKCNELLKSVAENK